MNDAANRARALSAAGAFRELIDAAAQDPAFQQSDEAAYLVALAHANTGSLQAATSILETVVARSAHRVEAKAALGRLYGMQGRHAESGALFSALESDARRDPRAALILGDAYMQTGRLAEAHRVFSVLKNATDASPAELGLAETFLRMQRWEEALAAARRAETKLGMTPQVLRVLGPAALCAEDEQLSQGCLSAVKQLSPALAVTMLDFWTSVLMAGGRYRNAALTCQEAARVSETPARQRLLADLRLSTRDLDGAIIAAERALALGPRDADAAVMLARCKIVAGDLEHAASLLMHAIADDPTCVQAYDYLSQIDPKLVDGKARTKLSEMQASMGALGKDAPALKLTAGRLAEAEGDYRKAFSDYLEANRYSALEAAAAGRRYDPAVTAAGLQRLIAAFSKPLSPIEAPPDVRPIFIVGMPRSGTSLLEQVLANHPGIFGGGELPAMVDTLNRFLARLAVTPSAQQVIDEEGSSWAARYVEMLPHGAAAKPRVTDKHPLNFWSIGLIAAILPQAQFIHVKRDPLDTCISILKQRFYVDYTFATDVEALTHYYAAYERMMAHWRGAMGELLFEVEYEEFVDTFDVSARRLVSECGLAWNDACADFHTSRRAVFTHSAAQVRAPANASKVGLWRKFGDSIDPLRDALARHRETFGVASTR